MSEIDPNSDWFQEIANGFDPEIFDPKIWQHFNESFLLESLHYVNDTVKQVNCQNEYKDADPVGHGCEASSDSVLCWPPTPANKFAVLQCMDRLKAGAVEVAYDTTQNATRFCNSDGTWNLTNYNACKEIHPSDVENASIITTSTIFFIGYSLSLVALTIAIAIFLYFKDLRCLRNTIHVNLMFTYVLVDFMWILTLILQVSVLETNMAWCIFLIILLHYFNLTNFFWMFVEGLYLYILVVETFTRENIKLRIYACIGWGIPIIFVVIWAVVKSITPVHNMELLSDNTNLYTHCPWMKQHSVDWIYQTPALAVLVLNLAFLASIMYVLITKLRSANTQETQQYRKATKALLVLIPLLGCTYVPVMYAPSEGYIRMVFDYIRALLLSTQGFCVAFLYCFMNTEVQNTLKHRIESWKTARSIGPRRMRASSRSKDWSPRSRTESIRLFSQPTNVYHNKRGSCTSEITTTTMITVNGGAPRTSNGGTANNLRSSFLLHSQQSANNHPRSSITGNV